MNFDQYEEPTYEQVQLARAAQKLIEALFDDDGKAIDLSDKEGRKRLEDTINRLENTIKSLPKSIPSELSYVDRQRIDMIGKKLDTNQESFKAWNKWWQKWFIGIIAVAALFLTLTVWFGNKWHAATEKVDILEKQVQLFNEFIKDNQETWNKWSPAS